MQDKLKKILRKMSLVTTHPDGDWLKVFLLLLLLSFLSLCWNVYFYFSVKHDITVSSQVSEQLPPQHGATAEEQIKKVIDMYDARAAANRATIDSPVAGATDPAGPITR